jgi:UDP-glucose 4-epimerase
MTGKVGRMRILVTGGAGYIGSVVTAALLDGGHEVTVLDDLSTGHADAVPSAATFVQASLHDSAPVLAEVRPEAVLHFAAKSLVGESQVMPEIYWDTNVSGSLALLEAMRAVGCRRIVFNVAGAAYGLGERHATETHLIPIALQVAAGQREHLTIHGEDYPTPDGTCIRDYIHVEDLSDAHLLALTAPAPGEHRIYNLGNGTGFSVQQVVDAVREVTGHAVPVEVGERRAGDPAQLVASSDRIRADLGWTPKHTDLAGIVRDAWKTAQKRA